MAKALGIFLVVLGHCSRVEHMTGYIAAFHMPFFFLLSGFFLFNKEVPMREFVVKKVKTLLVPCMCFGLILSTYSTLIDWLRPHADIPLGLRYIGLFINMREYPFPGSLWFLPCLFLVEVILYGLHKVIKGKWAFVASLVLLTCLGIGLHAAYGKGLPWSLDIALLVCGFTALGYWVRNKITCLLPPWVYALLLGLFVFCVEVNMSESGFTVDMYSCRLGNYGLFYAGALLGIVLMQRVVMWLLPLKWLDFFGRNSLVVYALHYIFILPLSKLLDFVPLPPVLLSFIQAILIMIILIPIIRFINAHYKWMLGQF